MKKIKEFLEEYKKRVLYKMYKKDFPYFTNSNSVYLDSGATTQKPQSVIDATVEYYTKYCSNTHRSGFGDAAHATTEFENTREVLQKFINAKKKRR